MFLLGKIPKDLLMAMYIRLERRNDSIFGFLLLALNPLSKCISMKSRD